MNMNVKFFVSMTAALTIGTLQITEHGTWQNWKRRTLWHNQTAQSSRFSLYVYVCRHSM